MKPLDTFFNNSEEITRYFLKRVLASGLGHCMLKPSSPRTILNNFWPFGYNAFKYTRDYCIKQGKAAIKNLWLYEPKLRVILDLLKRANLIKQKNDLFYLSSNKIELTLPRHLLFFSEYYPSFWRFCVILTSKLWMISLFEFPCKVSQEVLSLIYKSLFFREQINAALNMIVTEHSFFFHHGINMYFYPQVLSNYYINLEKLNVRIAEDVNDADIVVVNNFLNVYSLFELRNILKNKSFILIQPTKKMPLSAFPLLFSKRSLPENIMLKIDYSPTPISFVRYF